MIIRKQRPVGFPTLMDDFFNHDFFHAPSKIGTTPSVNIRQDENGFILDMAVPGLNKEDIKLEVKNSTLTISAEMKAETSEDKKELNFTRKEFNYNSFSRSFKLPKSVDQENISASHKNGVLSISIPQKEEVKDPIKQIAIA